MVGEAAGSTLVFFEPWPRARAMIWYCGLVGLSLDGVRAGAGRCSAWRL